MQSPLTSIGDKTAVVGQIRWSTWWISSHMEEPMASNFGLIVRLCTIVLHCWPWTCCQHQHQKLPIYRVVNCCEFLTFICSSNITVLLLLNVSHSGTRVVFKDNIWLTVLLMGLVIKYMSFLTPVHLFICLSVSRRWLKLASCNFHRRVAQRL